MPAASSFINNSFPYAVDALGTRYANALKSGSVVKLLQKYRGMAEYSAAYVNEAKQAGATDADIIIIPLRIGRRLAMVVSTDVTWPRGL